jgi:exodeoxyribonuclease VII large subunit
MAQIGMRFGNKPPARKAMRVRELVEKAHRTLERAFGPVWVEGEIANLKLAPSGHAYFSLRDGDANLNCAMWRSHVQRLRFRLEPGKQVRIYGKLGIYVAQGRFQMYAERAEPAGIGDLMARYERLKQKLRAEGLFDEDRKRALPSAPRVIGVVTSASGAAIHDICRVIGRRRPSRILLSSARVQGAEAPIELIEALRRLEAIDDVDVIIIGRGGGSLEDLWAFNDEGLARAVAECRVPIVSAVGHEVDVSLCDLVADVRAATPSAAGELVVRDQAELRRRVAALSRTLALRMERRALDTRHRQEQLAARLERCGHAALGDAKDELWALRRRLEATGRQLGRSQRRRLEVAQRRLDKAHPQTLIAQDRDRLHTLAARLESAQRAQVARTRARWARSTAQLDALSPLRVLERGYAVAQNDEGVAIRDASELKEGESLSLRFAHGKASVTVDEVQAGKKD